VKPKIFVTRHLPGPALKQLARTFDVAVNSEDRSLTKQEIIEGAKQADALLTLLTDTIDAEVIEATPHLQVISNYAVGYNNIDVEAATRAGIPVCFTPGVLTDTTADLAFALILGVARRLVESDQFLRKGAFDGWKPELLLGADVHHKRLGIVGFGRIGYAVAKRALGFDMEVIYTSRSPIRDSLKLDGVKPVDFETLLKTSDFISLHLPITHETHHLIGEAEFELMKETAFVINTARGPIIDEKALVKALKEGKIAGAGLDVFEREPNVERELLELKNTLLLPHIGSATLETRSQMGILAAENAIAIFSGRPPHAIVNPEVMDRKRLKSL
jgi:glyoxylate reductase